MPGRCLDIASISRYLHQVAALEDVLHVEGHVGTCARCREKLQRMRGHAEALFDDHGGDRPTTPGCPSLIALDHFLRGELRERQLVRIQEHLHDCPGCRQWTSARRSAGAVLEPRADWLPTRVPDVDLRVAPLGVRVAAGAEWLAGEGATLSARLELPEPPLPVPFVAHSRHVHICRDTPAGVLHGRIDLFGPEGFRLAAVLVGVDGPQPLLLWTRLRVHAAGERARRDARGTWLLDPGHYFLGACTHDPPLLALSVETDFVTPPTLVACGYDACRFGHFRLALVCFARAQTLQPQVAAYAALHRATAEFAQSFAIAQSDGDWRWREDEPRRAPLPPLPALATEDGASTPEAIANLVLGLARRSEAEAARRLANHTQRLSRRAFRPAYATFLARLREMLPRVENSVETPNRTP